MQSKLPHRTSVASLKDRQPGGTLSDQSGALFDRTGCSCDGPCLILVPVEEVGRRLLLTASLSYYRQSGHHCTSLVSSYGSSPASSDRSFVQQDMKMD